MKIEIKLKDLIVFLLIAITLVYCVLGINEIKREMKYAANFTAIVNQLNMNTNDIKTVAQAIQVVQQKTGITAEKK